MTAKELADCDKDLLELETLARAAALPTTYEAAVRFNKKWSKLDDDTSEEARALIQRFGKASEIAEKAHASE